MNITIKLTQSFEQSILDWLTECFESKYWVPFAKHDDDDKKVIHLEMIDAAVKAIQSDDWKRIEIQDGYRTDAYRHLEITADDFYVEIESVFGAKVKAISVHG